MRWARSCGKDKVVSGNFGIWRVIVIFITIFIINIIAQNGNFVVWFYGCICIYVKAQQNVYFIYVLFIVWYLLKAVKTNPSGLKQHSLIARTQLCEAQLMNTGSSWKQFHAQCLDWCAPCYRSILVPYGNLEGIDIWIIFFSALILNYWIYNMIACH